MNFGLEPGPGFPNFHASLTVTKSLKRLKNFNAETFKASLIIKLKLYYTISQVNDSAIGINIVNDTGISFGVGIALATAQACRAQPHSLPTFE